MKSKLLFALAAIFSINAEHTDKMIYHKITTTTTKDVIERSICSECKGTGFSWTR